MEATKRDLGAINKISQVPIHFRGTPNCGPKWAGSQAYSERSVIHPFLSAIEGIVNPENLAKTSETGNSGVSFSSDRAHLKGVNFDKLRAGGREQKGMGRVRELAPLILKEAFQRTARVAKAMCYLHVIDAHLCTVALLPGTSMLPTFNGRNIVLAERISPSRGNVGLGDVVIIRSPEVPTKIITKRIKAVEGDVVSYVVDDQPKTVVVPKGHVWVEGDNAHASRDSRMFGAVPYAHVHSRVFFVIWPPKDCRLIGNKVM